MGLKDYRAKRDFSRTPEPAPQSESSPATGHERQFVVQKHAATSLHYDLRLRVGNVLKSWAVPKGPSFDPREKRLAIEVEDHPLAYATFEGTIPEGQYGAGTVMVWDQGRWTPEGDAEASLRDGLLKFRLAGQRLKGRWMLARTKTGDRQPHWILVKERDAEANPGVGAETYITSVATGRSMEEITRGEPAREIPADQPSVSPSQLVGAKRAAMPEKFRPQLAEASPTAPDGDEWLHEVKFDGYRLLLFKRGERVTVLSRRGLDWTSKLPGLCEAVLERLQVDAVLDGEAVMLDKRGISDFQALQNAIHGRRSRSIVYFAFDLPWCDGFDLTKCSLESRRSVLKGLLGQGQDGRLRLSEYVEGQGARALAHARESGLEGIVSKRRSAPYAQSRVSSWLKVKCFNQQEFVIGGFTEPEGSREEFGALLIGYYEKPGVLEFAGKVGTGFSAETLKRLSQLLRTRIVVSPPFARPPTGAEARGVTWIEPTLVAQVQFRDWTGDGVVRHTSFRGLRDDIDPASVRREPIVNGAPTEPPLEKASAPSAVAPPSDPATSRRKLTNADRVVFPDRGAGFRATKRDVASYYEAVSSWLLPHIVQRPLAIVRSPRGEGAPSFFQKHPAKGMPIDVKSVQTEADGERHLLIEDLEGLIGLVQMNALEIHPWGSKASDIEHPDRLVFDLDPGDGVTWRQICHAAQMVRESLTQVGLHPFARTTGGKGVHLVVPIVPKHSWDTAKVFAKAVADTLARLAPRLFVSLANKDQRAGRIYIDYLRNARGATAVTSYSVRARPGAPVAMPVSWEELASLPGPDAFNVWSVPMRLRSGAADPWRDLEASAGTLPT